MSIEKSKKVLDSLQAVRALAATIVLLFPLSWMFLGKLNYSLGLHYFAFGQVGVDIFFVLSGFIIYYTNANSKTCFSPLEFLLRRMLRIFPIYWVSFLISVLIIIFVKHFYPLISQHSDSIANFNSGGLKALLLSFFLLSVKHRTVGVSWTLTYEMMFYTLFAIVFF